jgi:hypothetical protein
MFFYCENSVFEHGFNILWWLFFIEISLYWTSIFTNAGFNSQDIICLFTSKAVTKFHDSNRDAETEKCQACVKCYYSWLSLFRIRLTRISGWVKFLSKSWTSLCINIYNLTPVESNSDESKFRMSRIKVLVPRCRKPYYLHSLSQNYLSKHVYYLGIKIGSQVKHPVIEFDIFTLGYFTCLFHNLSN